jgi:hypothetical protein
MLRDGELEPAVATVGDCGCPCELDDCCWWFEEGCRGCPSGEAGIELMSGMLDVILSCRL